MNQFMIITTNFRYFKENSGLPSDVDPTWIAFNSVYSWAETASFPSNKEARIEC